jgi:hypothetical protein
MRARMAVAGVIGMIVALTLVSPAGAINPPEPGPVWICGGVPMEVSVDGRVVYIDGVKYRAIEYVVFGDDPTTGERINEVKTWGSGKKTAEVRVCVQSFSLPTFVGFVQVTVVPVKPTGIPLKVFSVDFSPNADCSAMVITNTGEGLWHWRSFDINGNVLNETDIAAGQSITEPWQDINGELGITGELLTAEEGSWFGGYVGAGFVAMYGGWTAANFALNGFEQCAGL